MEANLASIDNRLNESLQLLTNMSQSLQQQLQQQQKQTFNDNSTLATYDTVASLSTDIASKLSQEATTLLSTQTREMLTYMTNTVEAEMMRTRTEINAIADNQGRDWENRTAQLEQVIEDGILDLKQEMNKTCDEGRMTKNETETPNEASPAVEDQRCREADRQMADWMQQFADGLKAVATTLDIKEVNRTEVNQKDDLAQVEMEKESVKGADSATKMTERLLDHDLTSAKYPVIFYYLTRK